GAPARCASTTSASRASRSSPARCASAASPAARRTRTARPMRADRRWSRSAATASASTGPIRSTRRGTTSSIRTACPASRSWPTRNPAAASSSRRIIGSASPTAIGRTRSGSTAATARPTRSAIRRSEPGRSGSSLSGADWTTAGLWLAVIASGLYHGANPGMGWPLAVSAGLMDGSPRALVAGFWPLSAGHLLAMLLVLLPFALLAALVEWQRQIQIGGSLLVIGFGVYRLVSRRHPRALARIRPTQLGLWSFAVAIAHGAGLMLVPIYLGLCRAADLDKGHEAAGALGLQSGLGGCSIACDQPGEPALTRMAFGMRTCGPDVGTPRRSGG